MGLTKQQLEALNDSSFPNNNAGYITPAILRDYNDNVIQNTVNQDVYTTDSASFDSRIEAVDNDLVTTSSFNAYTQSTNNFTASISTSVGLLEEFSGSEYKGDSSSFDSRINGIVVGAGYVLTSSFNDYTQSTNGFTASVSSSVGLLQTFSGSQYKADSASFSSRIVAAENSGYVTTASFNAYTQSTNTTIAGLATTASVNTLSASIATTDSTQTNLINGKLDTASFNTFSSSNYQTDATQSFQITANALTASNGLTTLSSSVAQTDFTQSTKINNLTALTASTVYNNINNTFAAGTTQSFDSVVVTGIANVYELHTIINSSSVVYTSGSNTLGDEANVDVQTLIGRTKVSGSFEVTGSTNVVAFTASAAKISGLNYPTADDGAKSFIQTDGAGNLSLQYVDAINTNIHNSEAVTIAKGTPLFVSGATGANPNVYIADASNPLRMPVTYIAADNIGAGGTGRGIILGQIDGVNTTGYSEGTFIYVAEGGGWSSNRPSGSTSIVQPLGVVTKEGSGGKGLVLNPGPVSLPNIQTGYVWVGNGSNQPVALATSSFEVSGSSIALSASIYTTDETQTTNINDLTSKTGSYATTGSNTFVGNQLITGSVIISSSAAIDLIVTGAFQTQGNIVSSGSTGTTTLVPGTGILIQHPAQLSNSLYGRNVMRQNSGSNAMGMAANPSQGGWVAGITDPSIITYSGSSALGGYYAPIRFQGGEQYTDGRVSFVTPLSASAGFTASLLDGYAWVGNSIGQNYQVPTSSFGGGSTPAGTVSSSQQIIDLGFATTASINSYTSSTNLFTASITQSVTEITASITSLTASVTSLTQSVTEITASLTSITASVTANSQSIFNNSASIALLSSSFTLVSASALTHATTGSNTFIGTEIVTGSLIITGSVSTLPVALSVTSNTASVDFSKGSMFTLTIPSSAITYITASNLLPGQTANIVLTQQATTGSVRFESTLFKFPSGSINTGSAVASAVDMVSVASVNTTTLYSVGAKQLI